jgi:hypothetical protein
MKTIMILAAITLSGCLHEGSKASLYCDDMHIATSNTNFTTSGNTYRYKVNGQYYRYAAIQGSVCKIVEIE